MEVSLEPLALLLLRLDHALARALHFVQPGLQLGMEASVLERDGGRRGNPVQQLGLVGEGGIVDQRRRRLPVVLDQCGHTIIVRRRQPHGATVLVRPASELREPVGEAHGGVVEGPAEGIGQGCRRRVRLQLDHQLSHRRAAQALVEQSDQEDQRSQADGEEHHALDGEEPATTPG